MTAAWTTPRSPRQPSKSCSAGRRSTSPSGRSATATRCSTQRSRLPSPQPRKEPWIMDLQLKDRVVIVTGAAAGIGQATAGLLTAEGAVVVGVDRDEVKSGLGHEGSAIRADLTAALSAP